MNITLLDGRAVASENIFFDRDSYHQTLSPSGEDITRLIRFADKERLWPDFDPQKDLLRNWNENHNNGSGPAAPLDDSTASNLWRQLTTDPLGAPLDSLNRTIDKVFTSPATKKILIAGGAILVIYLAVKYSD